MDEVKKDVILYIIKLGWLNLKNRLGLSIIIGLEFILILFIIPFNLLKGLFNAPPFLMSFIEYIKPICYYPFWSRIAIFVFIMIATYIYWLFKSGRIKIKSKKFLIGMAIKKDNHKSNIIYRKTLKRVKQKLDSLQVLDKFEIREISTDLFDNIQEAEAFGKKNGFNLIIHGDISLDTKDGFNVFSMKDLFFTYFYHYNPVNMKTAEMIKRDISLMLMHRNWIIEEKNTYMGLEEISYAFVEIIIAIIAISIIFKKDMIEIATDLLEHILPIMVSRIPNKPIKLEITNRRAEIPIELLRTTRLKTLLQQASIYLALSYYFKNNYFRAIEIEEKILKEGASKDILSDCLINLAKCKYLTGNLEEAKLLTEEFNKVESNHPVYFLNKAFFNILENNHVTVIDCYSKLRNKKIDKETILDVISFLENEMKAKDIIGLEYGIAILTYFYIDKNGGRKLLINFSQKCQVQVYNDTINDILKITQHRTKSNKKKRKKRKK